MDRNNTTELINGLHTKSCTARRLIAQMNTVATDAMFSDHDFHMHSQSGHFHDDAFAAFGTDSDPNVMRDACTCGDNDDAISVRRGPVRNTKSWFVTAGELDGLDRTSCNLSCGGCGVYLATEGDFARHFVIARQRHLNLGECPAGEKAAAIIANGGTILDGF